jgi:diacylglycerol kinase family enzyme
VGSIPPAGTIPSRKATHFEKIRAYFERLLLVMARGGTFQFHADGEIIGFAPVEIEVVPRAVQTLAHR